MTQPRRLREAMRHLDEDGSDDEEVPSDDPELDEQEFHARLDQGLKSAPSINKNSIVTRVPVIENARLGRTFKVTTANTTDAALDFEDAMDDQPRLMSQQERGDLFAERLDILRYRLDRFDISLKISNDSIEYLIRPQTAGPPEVDDSFDLCLRDPNQISL
ncbi:MAG: hypothetical protein Q9199_002722 [Rusavskia elegans]